MAINTTKTDERSTEKSKLETLKRLFSYLLTYKIQWYGKELSIIDRFYPSSQICHICGNKDGRKSEDIRFWTCPNCKSELDRDINAAINILNEGLRMRTVGTTGIA